MRVRLHRLFVPDLNENPQKYARVLMSFLEAGVKHTIITEKEPEECPEPMLVVDNEYERIGHYEIDEYIGVHHTLGEVTPKLLPDSYGNRL